MTLCPQVSLIRFKPVNLRLPAEPCPFGLGDQLQKYSDNWTIVCWLLANTRLAWETTLRKKKDWKIIPDPLHGRKHHPTGH